MQGPSPSPPVFVACAFKNAAQAQEAVQSLIASGIAPSDIAIGAAGSARPVAAALAQALGVRDDVDPDDPLAGAPGLASASVGAESINRGGVIGAIAGAIGGALLGLLPSLQIVPVDPRYRVLATALLWLIVGALSGATLGGAFAPQRSTHAAFRIVDEIEHHGFAVVVIGDAESAAGARDLLAAGGGLHVMSAPDESPS